MILDILFTSGIFLLAAIGGLYSERAGILNIALEGFMLLGAFCTILFQTYLGFAPISVVLSMMCAFLLAIIFTWAAVGLRANIFVAGLAINLLATGFASFMSVLLFDTKGVIALDPTTVGETPWAIVGIAFAVAVLTSLVLSHTTFGLRLRVSGSDPDVLIGKGVQPDRYRISALLISAVCASVAGSGLALELGAFVPNMSGGRGWIALVAIYLGKRSPVGIIIACIAFAAVETATYRLQGVIEIPRTVYLAVPYIVTVIGLGLFSALDRRRRSAQDAS